MIGHETVEKEVFKLLYSIAVIEQLIRDGLLKFPIVPKLQPLGKEQLLELSQRYPLPSYELLSLCSYELLLGYSRDLWFTIDDLKELLETVEANNGYVL